ncbi:hypothetical protein GCM10020219_094840 [Nonomuraea dietziae]
MPAGTPSTDATETPPAIIAAALPTCCSGTSRVGRVAANAQKPPMLTPTSTLATSITA